MLIWGENIKRNKRRGEFDRKRNNAERRRKNLSYTGKVNAKKGDDTESQKGA
jgi:DNA-binding MarR family transcriptional regulator